MAPPKDLSSHLSNEVKLRNPSNLKELFKYFRDPSKVSLGGGLPLPTYFPFENVSVTAQSSDGTETINFSVSKYEQGSDGVEDILLSESLQYGHSAGVPILVDFVKQHTKTIHNPPYDGWDCVITVGSTHSLDSCLRMLTNPGDTVLAEEFTFSSAAETIRSQGLHIMAAPMDLQGMLPDKLEELLANWDSSVPGKKGMPIPRVMYIIPTGQNPTGSTVSLERRQKIYAICQKYDIVILEDEPYYFLQMEHYDPDHPQSPEVPAEVKNDPDRQQKFLQKLVPSFLSMDVDGRVLRMDTFSKVLAPGTRLGWITCNPLFAERLIRQHEVSVQTPAGFSQTLVFGLLNRWGQSGYIDWLIRLRYEYTARRDCAMQAIDKYISKKVSSYIAPEAGMFFWIRVDATKHPEFKELGGKGVETLLFGKLLESGLVIVPGRWFLSATPDTEYAEDNTAAYYRGNFASVPSEALERGIKLFGDVLNREFGL
ncbi:hypothetical protein CANCADRAFT_117634 [Tortispora caseinolytica NRRL Y-17796]|uniref:Aminotransferase class I/classII large domain-containing protein n=1 Tax=Tortispora caseinolytica NRRL Y-17796 TaxID=767744 RepID=A0A1E4THC4_9ASCO|nr:hypothetical protein CANCADRAFT_117634 [Tortispora caseinolytica NRRL Y-17796]